MRKKIKVTIGNKNECAKLDNIFKKSQRYPLNRAVHPEVITILIRESKRIGNNNIENIFIQSL